MNKSVRDYLQQLLGDIMTLIIVGQLASELMGQHRAPKVLIVFLMGILIVSLAVAGIYHWGKQHVSLPSEQTAGWLYLLNETGPSQQGLSWSKRLLVGLVLVVGIWAIIGDFAGWQTGWLGWLLLVVMGLVVAGNIVTWLCKRYVLPLR